MKLGTWILLLAGLSVVTVAPAPAQPASPAQDPARVEQELAKARDEKWPMVVVQLTSGQYIAFDPTRLKILAGNRVTVGRWAEAAIASTDEERIYFVLKYALTFEESCPMATLKEKKGMEFEVARILPPPLLLDSGPGSNRKEWTGSMFDKFGGSGATVAQMLVLSRKETPKISFDSLLVHLVNRGATGLEPEMEAAFMETLLSSRTRESWKVLQAPPEGQSEGKVLEVTLRLEKIDPYFLAVAFIRVDRASGDVVARAFGRGYIGRKVEKDVRSLADFCW